MTTVPDPSAGAGRTGRDWKAKPPARPVDEVLRDLQQERERLVAALDQLKAEARATRDRAASPRIWAIVGGALVGLFVLRRRRSRRRRSRSSL